MLHFLLGTALCIFIGERLAHYRRARRAYNLQFSGWGKTEAPRPPLVYSRLGHTPPAIPKPPKAPKPPRQQRIYPGLGH